MIHRKRKTPRPIPAERFPHDLPIDHRNRIILRPGQIFGGGIPLVNGAVARRAAGRWLVLGDGTIELPLVYIEDVVDAVIASIDRKITNGEVIQLIDAEHLTQTDVLNLAGGGANARTRFDPYLEWFGDPIDREIARRTAEVAKQRGVAPAAVAMAWVAGQPSVTAPLVGADAPDQVDAAVAASEMVLGEDERACLEAPYRPRDMINDYNPVRRARALSEGLGAEEETA